MRPAVDDDHVTGVRPGIGGPVAAAEADREVAGRTDRLEILVANAGVYGSRAPVGALTARDLLEVFDVNVAGAFRTVRAALPLLERAEGKIALITSLMGSIADDASGGSTPYRVSKAALNMLGRNLSIDLRGAGVTVAILHPGWVKTRMGGPDAEITVEESVTGMMKVIEALSPRNSGSFWNYDGRALPW